MSQGVSDFFGPRWWFFLHRASPRVSGGVRSFGLKPSSVLSRAQQSLKSECSRSPVCGGWGGEAQQPAGSQPPALWPLPSNLFQLTLMMGEALSLPKAGTPETVDWTETVASTKTVDGCASVYHLTEWGRMKSILAPSLSVCLPSQGPWPSFPNLSNGGRISPLWMPYECLADIDPSENNLFLLHF